MQNRWIQIKYAIEQVRQGVHWKPGKGEPHLAKRISQGHLSPATTLAGYAEVILGILSHPDALVYVYWYRNTEYTTIVAPHSGRIWLVMFDLDGTMETAFPPDQPEVYLDGDPKFILMGSVKEIVG